jgi:hypothetical protein
MERNARRGFFTHGGNHFRNRTKNPKCPVWHLKEETFRQGYQGDHSGSGSSKVVLYCDYSVR